MGKGKRALASLFDSLGDTVQNTVGQYTQGGQNLMQALTMMKVAQIMKESDPLYQAKLADALRPSKEERQSEYLAKQHERTKQRYEDLLQRTDQEMQGIVPQVQAAEAEKEAAIQAAQSMSPLRGLWERAKEHGIDPIAIGKDIGRAQFLRGQDLMTGKKRPLFGEGGVFKQFPASAGIGEKDKVLSGLTDQQKALQAVQDQIAGAGGPGGVADEELAAAEARLLGLGPDLEMDLKERQFAFKQQQAQQNLSMQQFKILQRLAAPYLEAAANGDIEKEEAQEQIMDIIDMMMEVTGGTGKGSSDVIKLD